MELIKIENRDGKETVSARELYDFLGLKKAHYSRWVSMNIEGDQFFQRGIDWEGFTIVVNGNETMEYALTLDMAKELSMLARNDKGKQARRYFIEVEKRARNLVAVSVDPAKSKKARRDLTDMWKAHGVKSPWEYGKLTQIEYEALGFGRNAKKALMDETQKGMLLIAETWEALKLGHAPDRLQYAGCAVSLMKTGLTVREQAKTLEIAH